MNALAWALLDFVWQGALVGCAAALVLVLLRKARPQTRYAVACAALLLCAALPIAGTLQRMIDADAAATTLLPLALAGDSVATAPPTFSTDHFAHWQQTLQARLPLVMLLWSAGAATLALRMLLGLLWVRRRSQPSRSRADLAWQARVTRLAIKMGITGPVRLGLVDDLPSPVTAGWWRPVILLPASLASGMPVDLLEALLAHELAHIRRHDYLVNLVQSAIEIVLFYHPAVWWLSSRIRLEREQIADDVAAHVLGEPRRLAIALSELDRFQLATHSHLAHAAHGGNLMKRIKRLVRPESEPLNWKMALPILGLAAACAAFYANAQTAPSQPKTEWLSVRGATDDAYALVRPGAKGTSGSGNRTDWKEIEAAKRAIPGEFLWFRHDGKGYVVRDAAVVARVVDAWAPVRRLGDEMDGYGREMDQHGKAMEALGQKMEKATEGLGKPDHKFERMAHQQERFGEKLEKLGRKMENASGERRDSLRREMEQLADQMRENGRQMAKQAETMKPNAESMQPMADVRYQMTEAGKPMKVLGKKMEVLGKQIDAEARVAEKAMRAVIKDAMAKGLAAPAPAA
jgi:beta-lactamase regulating signal transducer with metallopeptidase domain